MAIGNTVGAVIAAALFALPIPRAAAAISDGVVKLGVLTDMSGVFSGFSGPGSVVAAQMAAEDFMAATPGFKVEVVSADHLNKPDVASAIARRWLDTEGVDAILDLPNSAAALAVGEIVREKDKALLISGSSSSDLTGKACSPNTLQWTYDSWSTASVIGNAVVRSGGDSWYFLTVDYAAGHALERDMANAVRGAGGQVLGAVRTPLGAPDFSSYLLQAQASHAKVVGLALAGSDLANVVKQAGEFGIVKGGQRLAATVVFITDVHGFGLEAAQGLQFPGSFYWDLNDGTRAFARRFAERNGGAYPTMVQAGVYSSALHYLKSAHAIDSDTGGAVIKQMKAVPAEDPLFGKGAVRSDGRKMHDIYLFEVKRPAESHGPWDYLKVVARIPAEQAIRPLDQGGCPLVH